MSEPDVRGRAARAKTLLEDELFIEACEAVKEHCHAQFERARSADEAWRARQMLELGTVLIAHFRKAITEGRIDEEREERGVVRRLMHGRHARRNTV